MTIIDLLPSILDLCGLGKTDHQIDGKSIFTSKNNDYSALFHTSMGHASEDNPAMKCAGFIVTSLCGAEWAASGKVTQAVPENFPLKTEVCLWEDCKNDNQ